MLRISCYSVLDYDDRRLRTCHGQPAQAYQANIKAKRILYKWVQGHKTSGRMIGRVVGVHRVLSERTLYRSSNTGSAGLLGGLSLMFYKILFTNLAHQR